MNWMTTIPMRKSTHTPMTASMTAPSHAQNNDSVPATLRMCALRAQGAAKTTIPTRLANGPSPIGLRRRKNTNFPVVSLKFWSHPPITPNMPVRKFRKPCRRSLRCDNGQSGKYPATPIRTVLSTRTALKTTDTPVYHSTIQFQKHRQQNTTSSLSDIHPQARHRDACNIDQLRMAQQQPTHRTKNTSGATSTAVNGNLLVRAS